MSDLNNQEIEGYTNYYNPSSFKTTFASYNQDCSKEDPQLFQNAYSLTAPFMNSIEIPKYKNNYSVDLENNVSSVDLNNHFSRFNKYNYKYTPYKNNSILDTSFKKENVHKSSINIEKFSNNGNIKTTNHFPMAWTCYQDYNKQWICPLRGDKAKK